MSGGSLVMDLRPLQGGDAGRGIGSTVRGLAGSLPRPACLLWRGLPDPGEAAGREVVSVPGPARPGRLSWAVDGVRSVRVGARVVHYPSLDPAFGWAPRTVITVHDAIPWRFPRLYPAGPTGRLRRDLSARLARAAAVVVTPSRSSAADVTRYLGVAPERVRVVPWATDPGWREPRGEEVRAVRERLGLPDRYAVLAGGFAHSDPRKRFTDAVEALALLPADVGLVVTGSPGPAEAELTARVERLGLGARVVRTGQLEEGELAAVFGGACLFVFPSLWEGFGLPLLNAFALGVPAVISDGGSLPEVAGGAALVYPAGDVAALAREANRVLAEPALGQELVGRGRARAAEYSWAQVAAGYEQAYADAGAST